MARVVQQRSSPPYLLILMVFLFLIATTLAVLAYMNGNKLQDELKQQSDTQSKVAGPDDLRSDAVRKMIARYDNPPAGERPKSVVKQFLRQVDRLSRLVAGQQTDAEIAIAQATAALQAAGSSQGLAPELKNLDTQVALLHQQIDNKDQLLAQRQQQLADKDADIRRATAALQAKIDSLNDKIAAMDKKFTDAHNSYQADLASARQQWQKQRDELNKNVADKTAVIDKLQRMGMKLSSQVAKLQARIGKETPKTNAITVARKADGKILKVVPEENLCYIDLGSKDKVSAGITFTVYPSTGIPENGKGKASLVVTNVGKTVSECRLTSQQRSDPVVEGDLVANVAFDRTRTYTFVVIGNFDLYGTGSATPEGADKVKMLIKSFGGKVADAVDINTDFVIRGQRPKTPASPAEFAPPQERQVYREQLKVVERFDSEVARAESLHIPILNTNRFLAFIGYTPTLAGD